MDLGVSSMKLLSLDVVTVFGNTIILKEIGHTLMMVMLPWIFI